jgi:hypothetical protein
MHGRRAWIRAHPSGADPLSSSGAPGGASGRGCRPRAAVAGQPKRDGALEVGRRRAAASCTPRRYAVGHSVVGIRGASSQARRRTQPPDRRVALAADRRGATTDPRQHQQPRSLPHSNPSAPPAQLESEMDDGLAVTTVPRTLRDLAACLPFSILRRALAEADYLNVLDPLAIRAQLGQGRAGASTLRKALSLHRPELAQTRSLLEECFLTLVQQAGLPAPEVNPRVAGFMVDALLARRARGGRARRPREPREAGGPRA